MAQLITVFCEGPHDIAFIYRMLKTLAFKSYDSCIIGDLPVPFNSLIKQEVEKTDIEDLNLIQVRRSLLPSKVMKKDEKYIFLYSIGGDSRSDIRISMLNDIVSFVPVPGEINATPDGTTFSAIYLFDADDRGVTNRLNEINREINGVLGTKGTINFIENATFHTVYDINFGAYIFTGEDNNTGTLEGILLPLMEENNERIFANAQLFLSSYFDDSRLFPLKIRTNSTTGITAETRSSRGGEKYKFSNPKSLIGTAGQLQCSGKSNVVCISDSDFITLPKIQSNAKCVEITTFLNGI